MRRETLLKRIREKVIYNQDNYTIDDKGDGRYEVSHDDKTYSVEKHGENWQCTCPSFKYRHTCKHIDMLKNLGAIEGKQRHPIEKMEGMLKVVDPILKEVDPTYEVVGSFRRGKETFKDVDIIIHCSEDDFKVLGDTLAKLPNYERTIQGDKLIRGVYHTDDLDIDLDINRDYTDTPAAMLLYRTGPANLNKFMRLKAMSYGWSLSEKGLYDHITGEKVSVPQDSERDIFNALNIPYLTPAQRERWDTILPIDSLNTEIRRDLNKNIYSEGSKGLSLITKVIQDNKDELISAIQKSKATSVGDATVYHVKKYLKGIIASPYSGEILTAFYNVTGLPAYKDWRKEEL